MRSWSRTAAVVLVWALLAAACADDDAAEGPVGGEGVVASGLDRVDPPADAPVAEVVMGMTDIGFDLYRIAVEDAADGNVVLSPASIDVAFTMASAGALGDTKLDLGELFGLPPEPGSHEAQNLLTATLENAQLDNPDTGETIVLELVNSVWGQAGMEFGQQFLDTLASHYGAGLRAIDFGDAEPARETINGWVSEQTRERIPDLLPPGFIKPALTRLVLVNAVYLKATWAEQFSEGSTQPAPFERLDGTSVDVPTMHAFGVSSRYAEGPDAVAVELPYSGGELSMLVIVPTDLSVTQAALSSDWLAALDRQLMGSSVDLFLPKWDFKTDFDLGPAMTELGFPIPGGDFGGIAPGLFIGEAIHAANITVNEQGTEAAAATAIGFEESAPEITAEVRVDRPFLFVIRHMATGTPLFLGRVTDPSAS